MDFEEFMKPSTLEETARKLREGGGKKKMYVIVWDDGQSLVVAPNEVRKSDDVLIEIEADIWGPFVDDMIELIGGRYHLSRKELKDALEIYKNEYHQHWFEENWPKSVLKRISFKGEF